MGDKYAITGQTYKLTIRRKKKIVTKGKGTIYLWQEWRKYSPGGFTIKTPRRDVVFPPDYVQFGSSDGLPSYGLSDAVEARKPPPPPPPPPSYHE